MKGELGVTKIPEFSENKSLDTDFSGTQQVDELLRNMQFLKLVPLRREVGFYESEPS